MKRKSAGRRDVVEMEGIALNMAAYERLLERLARAAGRAGEGRYPLFSAVRSELSLRGASRDLDGVAQTSPYGKDGVEALTRSPLDLAIGLQKELGCTADLVAPASWRQGEAAFGKAKERLVADWSKIAFEAVVEAGQGLSSEWAERGEDATLVSLGELSLSVALTANALADEDAPLARSAGFDGRAFARSLAALDAAHLSCGLTVGYFWAGDAGDGVGVVASQDRRHALSFFCMKGVETVLCHGVSEEAFLDSSADSLWVCPEFEGAFGISGPGSYVNGAGLARELGFGAERILEKDAEAGRIDEAPASTGRVSGRRGAASGARAKSERGETPRRRTVVGGSRRASLGDGEAMVP